MSNYVRRRRLVADRAVALLERVGPCHASQIAPLIEDGNVSPTTRQVAQALVRDPRVVSIRKRDGRNDPLIYTLQGHVEVVA